MNDTTNKLLLDIRDLLKAKEFNQLETKRLLNSPGLITLSASQRLDFFDAFRSIQIIGLTGDVRVGFNNQTPQLLYAGYYYETPDTDQFINQLTILEGSGSAGGAIEFQLGYGKQDDRRLNLATGGLVIEGNSLHSTPVQVTVGTTAASVLAASTNRTGGLFQNNGLTNIWIGDINVDAVTQRGVKLTPGAIFTHTSKAEFYADSDAPGGLLNIYTEGN